MKKLELFLLLTYGSIIFGIGYSLFIEPAKLAPGGVSGIVTIISNIHPSIDSGITFLLLNIPILIIGTIKFGKTFLLGTLYATVLSSTTISLVNMFTIPALSNDILCMSISGGVISGIGLGLVFRAEATTGGTDIIARIIQNRFSRVSIGLIFFILDATVIILSGVILRDFDIIVYSALCAALTSYILEKILFIKKNLKA